jgi:hypothetical protein
LDDDGAWVATYLLLFYFLPLAAPPTLGSWNLYGFGFPERQATMMKAFVSLQVFLLRLSATSRLPGEARSEKERRLGKSGPMLELCQVWLRHREYQPLAEGAWLVMLSRYSCNM